MKTLTTIFLALVISAGSAFAQPVKDKAVIPVGITLNSVLRLDIVSGGSIEFVFTTLADYTSGINSGFNISQYQTLIEIASSGDFDLWMGAETTDFIGSNTTGDLPLNILEYDITQTGSGGTFVIASDGSPVAISNTLTEVIDGSGGSAGDASQNAFTIDWGAGVTNTLLGESYASDRYVANILLELMPAN